MDRTAHALRLIDQLYLASIGEVAWDDFVAELSKAYGGALVCLCLGEPRDPQLHELHTAGLAENFGGSFWRHWMEQLPWKLRHRKMFSDGFQSLGGALLGGDVTESDFYRLWMAPRGLPAVWPICLNVATRPLNPKAVLVVLRQPGAGANAEFSQDDLTFGRQLLPHLRRAFDLHAEMLGDDRNRRALREVVERLRMGVILLDGDRRLLQSNRSADHTLASKGALGLRERQLYASQPDDDRKLQAAISRALENSRLQRFHLEESIYFGQVEHWNLEFLVKPLLSGARGSAAEDAVVVVVIANPAEVSTFPSLTVRRRYSLTRAEAELVQLLVEGASLDQAAERRGVALTTAKSQLKSIFAKTGTNRQSELVRVVLAGMMAVWNVAEAIELEARRSTSAAEHRR